ncbi:hypothetical protein GCM10010409_31090 [Mycolicibacterium diernhoferi]|uniref:non-specific serine/threonine protein kinase n=3 Tax=Mycolicibacterium diernhoferi TaxID=1801 RepID=A0A1T3WME1_9MYCO|nr:hypothetical protein BV510_04470 [Mycolicibacterium diernhoferi]
MPLRIGDTFAGYRVLRLLGSGGMGQVYLVQHPRLPRQEALKVLRPDLSQDESFRERFTREADLASGLRHPHIVGIHDRGEYEGQLWIAMDYIDGTDLAELLGQRYPQGMPVGHVLPIVTAVAGALDYAHKKGLLHRDVKPANIIVADLDTDDPKVFLADFGIARPLDDTCGITTTNMTVGTVAYAAPEQLMGEPMDGRADQYALAATTYHLLTGSHLFPNSNPAVVISRHLNTPPPSLASIHSGLASLDQSISVALDKDPDRRYARCVELSDSLILRSNADGSVSGSAQTAFARAATPSRDPNLGLHSRNSARSKRTVRSVVLSLCAALALAALILVWRPWAASDASSSDLGSTPVLPPSASSSPEVSSVLETTTPPPPEFPASSIDSILLTPADITALTDGVFDGDPPGGRAVELLNSSQGTSDNTHAADPSACVGVLHGAEQQVYAGTGYEAVRDQTLGKTISYIDDLVQQSVVIFASAEQAQAILDSSNVRWNECADGHPTAYSSDSSVDEDLGYERGFSWYLSDPARTTSMLTMHMTAANVENAQTPACQVALGIRDNVVVQTRTCRDVGTTRPFGSGSQIPSRPDPSMAGDYAERLANAMLNRVGG